MGMYRLTASIKKKIVARAVQHNYSLEEALADFKKIYADEAYGFMAEAEQVSGEFGAPHRSSLLCTVNGEAIVVVVKEREWHVCVGGFGAPITNVPALYANMAKARARELAYDAGFYTMSAPPVCTVGWSKYDWMNYVTYNYPI